MPTAPKKPCSYPGCPNIVDSGSRCPTHARKAWASKGSGGRGGRRWDELRIVILARDPVCKCGRAAVEVDHIVPVSMGGERFDPENLQGLCKDCHALKTQRERKGRKNGFDPSLSDRA